MVVKQAKTVRARDGVALIEDGRPKGGGGKLENLCHKTKKPKINSWLTAHEGW